MSVALRPVAAVFLVLALAACDAAPGFADSTARPVFAEVTITPVDVALAGSAPVTTVPLAVVGTVEAEAPVEVRVLVRYAETDSLVTSTLAVVDPGAFTVDAPITLPRGAIGDYSVRVYTEGADGRAGDQATALLRFTAENLGAPSLSVNEPAPVTRPSPDARGAAATVDVPLIATVTDPDGRANVRLVYVQFADGGGVIDRIYDNGPGSDGRGPDAVADDGVYSGALEINSGTEPGRYDLEVIAVDRYGAESAPVPFSFTVR
ncbi:choice-of-anchor X domain-containing protein [Rubrivirga sp. IMCC43871]|uniref:choice-of-anchor X domain-containing protein n=1 Tax=Rubrivirga sp. IMCC43871 TaxID=3391575 RepID=UPI00398FD297